MRAVGSGSRVEINSFEHFFPFDTFFALDRSQRQVWNKWVEFGLNFGQQPQNIVSLSDKKTCFFQRHRRFLQRCAFFAFIGTSAKKADA